LPKQNCLYENAAEIVERRLSGGQSPALTGADALGSNLFDPNAMLMLARQTPTSKTRGLDNLSSPSTFSQASEGGSEIDRYLTGTGAPWTLCPSLTNHCWCVTR